jgi:3-oxoacyl-[acyl-carrier protein] reductase
VTGGARGIGASIARRLSDDGNAVAVLDLDEDGAIAIAEDLKSRGSRAWGGRVDVADSSSVDCAVGNVVNNLGEPTILVNNAGVLRDNLLFKMSEDDWDTVAGVHLRGAFLMTKSVQGYMRDAGFGRIVNLSSTSALGNRGQANYAAAKAGLQGFTKTIAIELGKFGITSNAVAPGFIVTEMTRATADRVGQNFDDFTAARVANIPVARAGSPEDIAQVVSFFADERSGFVTGQVVYAAGGPRG